jgi:hypothetical protein
MITDPYLVAHPGLISWIDPAGVVVSQGTVMFTTPVLSALTANDCPNRVYPYKVAIADSGCGPQTQSLPIAVDHESEAGALQATPPQVCYKQASKIKLPSKCGLVTGWEQSINNGVTWTPIPGAGTTSDYWTPELLVTTMFRVTVQNGSCGPVTSQITVNVKPQLTATLSTNSNVLCGPVTLTAQVPTGYPPPLTYRWYRNGILINTTTSPVNTLSVTQPGNYRVVVDDPACGKAKSNVITIYQKPTIIISGPCGICQGGSISLKAVITGGDPNCPYNFNWSTNPGTWTATGQTVSATPNLAPGGTITFNVTATCGGCTISASQVVTRCPP